MSTRASILGLLALAALTTGCIQPRAVGHFGDGAFYLTRGHYRVRYASAGAPRLLADAWRLESYRFDERGHPIEASRDPRFLHTYDAQALVPTLRPGRHQGALVMERYDLWFRHEEGRGAIWARSAPLAHRWSGMDPIHLAHAGVYGMDGRWGPPPDLIGLGMPTHFLVGVHRERLARVDGQSAYTMTFDLVPRADPGARPSRTTIIVVQPPSAIFAERRVRARMAVVFGCTSPPERHDEVLADLEQLVRRVDFAP